jgi:hypothetical protein
MSVDVAPAETLMPYSIPSASAACHEQVEHLRVDRRAALEDRAAADLRLAELPRLPFGNIRGSRHVDREGDVRLEGEDARPRSAVVADLLLNGRDRRHVPARSPRLGDEPGRFERDVGAQPVVHGP